MIDSGTGTSNPGSALGNADCTVGACESCLRFDNHAAGARLEFRIAWCCQTQEFNVAGQVNDLALLRDGGFIGANIDNRTVLTIRVEMWGVDFGAVVVRVMAEFRAV